MFVYRPCLVVAIALLTDPQTGFARSLVSRVKLWLFIPNVFQRELCVRPCCVLSRFHSVRLHKTRNCVVGKNNLLLSADTCTFDRASHITWHAPDASTCTLAESQRRAQKEGEGLRVPKSFKHIKICSKNI